MNDEPLPLFTLRDYLTGRTEIEGKSPMSAIVINPEERRTWEAWQAITDEAGDDRPD